MRKIIRFVKDWSLPIVMLAGILAYFIAAELPLSANAHNIINKSIDIIQPLLIFCMLFISFCKIDPAKLRPCKWHLWLMLIQSGLFVGLALISKFFHCGESVIIECAMLCLICPTATAAVVITDKLGGNTLSLVAYTIISNIVTAVVVPLVLPLINPSIGNHFLHSFYIIIKQIFPLLVCPFLLAWLVRIFAPRLLKIITSIKDLAFYLWMVALAIALAVTTRAIVHSNITTSYFIGISIVTLFCCVFQFYVGKHIGSHYNDRISAGQAMGQKNTVFIIWMAYTFMNPVSAVTGGFYSIWHNTINSYQLYKKRKQSALCATKN